MEINYETIIQYLVKNCNIIKEESNKDKFVNKKHLITYSDLFPEKFSEILQNKFYRYGVSQEYKHQNISLFTSILTLLDKTFITFSDDEEIQSILSFKTIINNAIQDHVFSQEINNFIIKNKINKKYIINNIDVLLIQCISEIFDINFIIFDFNNNNKILSIFPDLTMNPWKLTLLLANWDDIWEPIIYDVNSKKYFSYNDQYIKKIYSSVKIEYYKKEIINKEFEIRDNLKEILHEITMVDGDNDEDDDDCSISNTESNENNNDNNDDNHEIDATFIKSEYSNNKLNKMTKVELLEILKNKNIKNVNIKMLKNKLIELILQA